MPKLTTIQTNFTGGEISPKMKGRVDVERYRNGVEILENARVLVSGGAPRRGGFRYLATAKHGGERVVRVLRYVFNKDQSYLLEFGHLYVRVFASNGAVVLDAAGTAPLEIASPYTEDQLAQVKVTQGGDTLFLFHPDVAPQRLRRLTSTLWAMSPVPFVAEPFAELGESPDARLTLSAATVGARTATTSAVTAPDAPIIGTAFARNGGASITFTPPADDGGLEPSEYTATSDPDGITASAEDSPIVMTGLTNGTPYTFTVTATNSVGTSPASAASNSVTPNASAPSGELTATADVLTKHQIVRNGLVLDLTGPTATGATGTAPFSVSWEKLSGDAGIRITTADAAQVVFSSENMGATNYASFRATVTDALGDSGTVDVSVSVTHRYTRTDLEPV